MATTSPAADDVKYVFFGSNGARNDQFNNPMGMAFNRDKTEIFVADFLNNRVQVLNYHRGTGGLTFKHTISAKLKNGESNGNLHRPTGVALLLSSEGSGDDKIVVADKENNKVCGFKCVSLFEWLDEYNIDRPNSVAVDNVGNIFAYDSSNCRIAIPNKGETNYICTKGKGKDPGQLSGSGTLAFDKEGNLVVADGGNDRVQVLKSSNGAHLRTITGNHGGRGGQLSGPCGIAFTDDYAHIIIANFKSNQVHLLTYPEGKIVKSFGEFNGPYGVLVDDENGRIIVSEAGNHRIQVIHNALPKKKLAKVEDPSKPSKRYPNLEIAIRNAITTFSTSLGDHEYAAILTKLNEKIDEDRNRLNNPDLLLSELLKKVTKPPKEKTKRVKAAVKTAEPKPVSKQMSVDEVTNFISSQKDAIFVVTGGSFNPPHNGHIGMFQKAYDALIKKFPPSKKVYGVMAPASDKWIEGKLCKEATGKSEDCNDTELAAKESQAAINSKRIQVAERVNLCKLSCDSYAWTDSANFNASNMIVVNDPKGVQGEQFTSAVNTYYLCGSDYYKESKTTKFICVLRKGDKRDPIKDTDIIVNGSDIDNDASSTMLRAILTEINSVVVKGDEVGDISTNGDELLKLISMPVLRRLLDLKYILTDSVKSKKVLSIMGIELDAPDVKSSNDTDSKLKNEAGVRNSGSRSLCNIGSMCYMNAALQLIYSMPDFRTAIKTPTNPLTEYLTAMDKGVSYDQARQLARSLYDLARKNSFATYDDKSKPRSFNEQEDASELITTVLSAKRFDNFKKSMEFTSIDALIYDGSAHISDECKNINEDSKKMVPHGDHAKLISLYKATTGTVLMASIVNGIRNLTTFNEVFDEHLKRTTDIEEKVNDYADALADRNLSDKSGIINNLPACMMNVKTGAGKPISKILKPVCKPLIEVEKSSSEHKPFKLKNIKNKTYISPGLDQKYFIVILQRSSTSSDGKSQTKLKHSVTLENANINIGDRLFIITGCICHHGDSPQSGHYTYVAFTGGNPTTVYDDHNIVEYATYNRKIPGRTVDTTGYVLLFEDMTKK